MKRHDLQRADDLRQRDAGGDVRRQGAAFLSMAFSVFGLRAGILRDRGFATEAMEDYDEGVRILERMRTSSPGHALISCRLALLLWQKGRMLGMEGKREQEIELLRRSKSLLAELEAGKDAGGLRHEQIQRSAVYVLGDLGHALQITGQRDKALEVFREALVLWEALSRSRPRCEEYSEGLVWCRQRVEELERVRIGLGSVAFVRRIGVPMVPSETDSRVRQIVSGVGLLVGIMVLVCGVLLGWRYLPGVLGEWIGTMVGLATTPFLLEASFVIIGFCVVFWLNHRSEKKEGGEWVYLEQVEGADLPEHARWAVLPGDAPCGVEPGWWDRAEGAADVGDWEELAGLLVKLDEVELKQPRVLWLRERLARASGRLDLAVELAEERKAMDGHA